MVVSSISVSEGRERVLAGGVWIVVMVGGEGEYED